MDRRVPFDYCGSIAGANGRLGCPGRNGALGLGATRANKRAPLLAILMGWAFVGLTLGSLIWIVAGYLASDYALVAQNVAITLINCLGIYRWLIWKGKA